MEFRIGGGDEIEAEARRVLLGSPLVKRRDSLPRGELWVLGRTIYPWMELTPHGPEPVRVAPQNADFRAKVEGPSQGEVAERVEFSVASAEVLVRRARNFMAGVADVRVPMVLVRVSEFVLFPETFPADWTEFYPIEFTTDPQRYVPWARRLEQSARDAGRLLEELPLGSPEDRALRCLGEAVHTRTYDLETAFLSLWRSMEVVAAADLASAREDYEKGGREAARPYLELHAGQLLSEKPSRISGLSKVTISAKRRAAHVPLDRLREFNELRGAIAHGTTSPAQFAKVQRGYAELEEIARSMVSSTLPGVSLPESKRKVASSALLETQRKLREKVQGVGPPRTPESSP
jgi:hypothetical protein